MNTKTYTLFVEGQDAVDYGSKKTAVKYGELSGKTYQVHSPSGAVVHAVKVEAEELVVEPEEDLIGETPADPEPKPETAKETPEPESEDVTAEADAELADETPVSAKPVDIEKMKDRIAMFLAKAEATQFEEERDTFNAAAEKLMIRLGIARAELEGRGDVKPENIIEVRREYPGNYSISYIPFVYSIAMGFGHLTVLQQRTPGLTRYAYIIGTESDVREFCTLLDSLETQVKSALRQWQRENIEARRGLTDMQKFLQHRSFIEGFGARVGTRLKERRGKEEVGLSTGTELVLVSKDERRQGFIDENYGSLEVDKARRNHSSIGFAAGREAGDKASLGEKAVKGTAGALES